MVERIVSAILERPRTCLAAGLVLVLFFVSGVRQATTDFGYRNWFREGDPLLERYDAFEARFGNDEAVVVVLHSPSGVFDAETSRLVVELTHALEAIDDIARVDSLATLESIDAHGDDLRIVPYLPARSWSKAELEDLRRKAVNDELAPGYLVSADARTTLLFAWLRSAPRENLDPTRALDAARQLLKERRDLGDHRFFVHGGPALVDAFRVAAEHDAKTLLPLVVGLMILLLAAAFRRIGGVLLPFVVALASVAMTVGVAGLAGLPFNNVTAAVPQFLIAISVATTMHLLLAFYRLRGVGVSQRRAAYESLSSNFKPTLLTSVSTAVGFFSFATAAVQPIAHLGALSGVGTLLAWIATYCLVGPLLVLAPSPLATGNRVFRSVVDPGRFTSGIARFRLPIVVGFLIASVSAGVLGVRNRVNSDPMDYFAEDVPIRQATRFAETNLGGVIGVELLIAADGFEGIDDLELWRSVDELQSWIDGQAFVTKTVSALDFIKPLHRAVHQGAPGEYRLPDDQALLSQLMLFLPSRVDSAYLDAETSALRLSVLWTLHDANASIDAALAIENKARALGLTALATGKNLLYSQLNEHVVRTFVTSLVLALASVSALLVVAFRSLPLGALALIPNVVPLLMGAGLLTFLGKPLDIGTVIMSSVCLGIAVDDTIHFLSAYHEHRARGLAPVVAVATVLRTVGPALVGTTLVLVAGFGVLVFASFVPNQNFGLLVSFGLVMALGADLLLLPALLLSKFTDRLRSFGRRANLDELRVAARGLGRVLGVLLLASLGRGEERDGRDIAERTLARDDGTVVFREVELASCDYEIVETVHRCTSKPSQKRLRALMENVGPHRHDVMVLSVLEAPAAEKGVGYLQRNHSEKGLDSEQWLYLPALKKAKRITTEASGGPKRGHVFGSELAYEDLEQWHLDDFAYKLLGEEQVHGRTSWVLELVPTPTRARKSSYQRTKMWIDQEGWLPTRVEAFKTGDAPVKTIHNRDLENHDGIWLSRETVVVNHESERMSLFRTVSTVVNPEVPPSWSHTRALEDKSYREPVFAELARQAR